MGTVIGIIAVIGFMAVLGHEMKRDELEDKEKQLKNKETHFEKIEQENAELKKRLLDQQQQKMLLDQKPQALTNEQIFTRFLIIIAACLAIVLTILYI